MMKQSVNFSPSVASDVDDSSKSDLDPAPNIDDQEHEIRRLLRSENRDVAKWRVMVTLMITATAVLVIYFAHKFLVHGEETDFQNGVSNFLVLSQVLLVDRLGCR
jgi:hypothetical protein